MSQADKQNSDIEHLLKQAHPAGPCDRLKERVLQAAREAWHEHPGPTLRRIALRRLAVSAAAAVFLVVVTDAWSDFVVTRSRSASPIARVTDDSQQWADIEPEIPYGSLLGRMVLASRPAAADPGAMRDYIQRLRDALDQTDDNGAAGKQS
jgi:hypothetical protein